MNWSSWGQHMYCAGIHLGRAPHSMRLPLSHGSRNFPWSVRRLFLRSLLVDAAKRLRESRIGRISAATQDSRALCKFALGATRPSEALPIPAATEPAPEVAKSSITEEPKETKKREARTTPRRARPVREQPNLFWPYASSRSSGSRPWF